MRKIPQEQWKTSAIRRNDLILILALALTAIALLILQAASFVRPESPALLICVNGKEYGTYPLTADRIIPIHDTNICEIKDGKVKMTSADCPDKICLHERAIDESGGTIVCLPNKIVLSIVNAKETEGEPLDGIAH